jgi:predicted transposase/invertase (TIGR01784 family)
MKLGISPKNDFAFAKTFARPENKIALLSLLNAILMLEESIMDVTIQNPFNYRDFAEDKLTILDIKAVDAQGRVFNVEMQLTVGEGLQKRIVYYGCETYTDQLHKGNDYRALQPVFAICIVDGKIWREKDGSKVHHRFVFTDQVSGRQLQDTIEIHTLELGWYTLEEADLAAASPAERWMYWLIHAEEYTADRLRELFPEAAFQIATDSLVEIHEKTEDKAMYDAREKAQRDYQWALNSSEARGRIEGKIEGRIEGKVELIRTLQSILRISQTPATELSKKSLDELQKLTEDLQSQIQNRSV